MDTFILLSLLKQVGRQNEGTSCDACAIGRSGGSGNTACTNCVPGQYSDSIGAVECDPCPSGKFQNLEQQST